MFGDGGDFIIARDIVITAKKLVNLGTGQFE